ncbi:hypothetical protein ACHWQZ_G017342 [Mnemiopsis leidyi]
MTWNFTTSTTSQNTSDGGVVSAEEWKSTSPSHLYPYCIHDALSVKFVSNTGGEEVRSKTMSKSDSETALYLYEQATICSKLRSTLDTSSLVESYRSDTHPLSVLTKCRRTANRTINRESRGGYNDSPRDTQADDKNNKPANTTDNSTNSNVSQSRRNNVSGRGALFDGSRGRKLTTGSDDDGEDDEDKKVRQKLLNQCEASSSTSDPLPKVKLKEDNNEAENPRTAAPDPNTNTELAKLDNSRPENWVISPIALINRDAKQTPRQRSNPNVNSTALDQSHAGYHLFDTSLLQGISRIWQSARNVSLFGTSYSRQNTSLGSNQVERIRANPATDESFGSDLEDQLPDISDISLDVLQNQTVVEHIKTAQNQPEGSGKDTHQAHAPESDCFVGVANPEITPVAFHVRESRTFFTPLNRSGSKIRTKSECSPFVRNGPYELPHSVIVRKSKRTEIRFNLLDNRSDQTPIGRRKRTASESFNFNSSQGNLEINCIRAREPGLYDCSSGLGEYVHLEHMFLDKADTGRIDKRKLLESVEKFLTITGDQQSQGLPNTVKLSWDDEEVLEASGNLSTHLAHHIDQRKNLVFLLGRMINHATRLTGKRLTYNGINLTVLPDQTKVPLKCPENCPDQPIVALYIGKGIDVNIVPKKRDWVRPNVHDIHMENFSLLTIFPETISHMNISIPEVREETETHLLITPYFIDHSDEVPKENRSASSKETEIGINSVQVEGRTPAQNPDATEPPAVNEELVDNSINTSCLKDDYDNEKLAPVLNPEQQGNCKGDIAHNDSTENTTGLVVQSGQTSVEVEVLTEKPDAVHPKANNIEQNDLDDPDLRKKEENGCLTISSGKLKPTNHRDSNETDIGESEPNKVLLTDDTARTDFTTCRAKPFISKETIVNICNGNSGNKITDWLKLCNLRLGHTAEANRKIILDHLSRAAEGKVKLPPLLVEKLVKRLKIEAVTTELINIGLDLPKNAAKRKSTLAMYLTSEFTTLNVSDYNETCDLERSRLGTNKSYLKGFQKSHKAKAPKSKKKSKARKPKSVSDKPVEHSPENYKSGPSPGNETGKTSVVMCPGNRIAEIEMTGATSDPAIKIIEASGKDDKKMTLTERMNEVLAAKDLNLDDTANIRMNNNSNDDAAKRLQNRVATKKDATDRVHTRSKNKDPPKGLNENAGKKLEGDPDEKPKSESVAKTKRKDIPEKRSDKPGKGITSATERGNKEEPKAKVKKAKSDMISPQGTHKSSSARTEKLTSVKNKESIDPKDKKKQIRKETTPKETDTENVFHPPSSADKENHPRDFEKPLRTLEASLLKLQDNINAQSEQITLLSAKVLAPDRNPEKINHNADLLDLRSKVDTLLKTIEVQQETLLQLTESKESQKQHFSVFPCNNYDTPCPDCQQCKEEISELKATVSSLRKDFMVLKRNAEKPCPCSEKAQRTIVYQEHSYCKFPTNMQVESERRSQAVETEVNFGNVVSCHEIEVGQYVTLEACSSQCSSPQGMTDSRSKCFIIQDGKLNSADKKNLGAKYEIEYLQVSSLKKALDSIQSIQERIQKAAPEMVFLNFGMSEVREASSSALQFPNKIYRRLIAKCAEPLRSGSKIVIASLPLTKKNRSLNERITNFNNGIAKMTPNLKLNIELRHAEQMHPKPKEDNEFSSVEESNSWKTQDKGNQNEDIEIGNSADTQPIPVLKGNRTRSTVPTEVGTEMPVRQGIPPERTQLNDQVNYDAGKLHVQETRPDRSCLDNRISIAQAEGRTVSYPHMSNNGAGREHVGTETKETQGTNTRPRRRTRSHSSSSAYRTRENSQQPGTKDAPRRKPERKTPTDADKNKISTGASMSDGCGTDVNRGTKQRCLLVHDDFLNAFDDTKFTSAVTVECFKAKSTSHLIRTGGLISRVRKVKPDVVYIHTGFEDLYKNKMSPKNLLENYTKIIYDLLESTPTKVCISSIIPIPGYPELDRDIGRANKKVVDFVTSLRNSPAYNDRIFCSCNNRVGGYVTREVGSHGIDLFVGDRVMLENIPILSWNIHDSITSKEGPKINDDEFVATLTKSTIFCLQETKKEFFLPNYECFNSTRNDSRANNTDLGDVMMVGDLNARTGNLNIDPVIEEDLEHDIPTSHPGTSERVSKDQVLLDELEDAPRKFKWDNQDEGLKQRFLAAQNAPDLKMKIEKISDYRCKDREEVLELNEELVSVYQELADGVLLKRNSVTKRRKAKAKRQAIKPKAPWFDTSCINAKRELNRLAKSYGKKPTDENLRNEYYDKRREYRKLIKQKKANFIKNLYEDIEAGKDVNWRRFKKIKDMKASGSKLDVFDMVDRVGVRLLDGSQVEILAVWFSKDRVDVEVIDEQVQPLDCSDIRAACSDVLGLLSPLLVWTFHFELRYTISVSITKTTDGKVWEKKKGFSELLRRKLTQMSFDQVPVGSTFQVRYKTESINPPDGYTRLEPTRDHEYTKIPFSPTAHLFLLQQRLVPRFTSSSSWNRIVVGNLPQLIVYWKFSADYPTEIHVMASLKTSTAEDQIFKKTWSFTTEDGDEYNRVALVVGVSPDKTTITIGGVSGDIPTDKLGLEPTEVQIIVQDLYHDAMYTISDKVSPHALQDSFVITRLFNNFWPRKCSPDFKKLFARSGKSMSWLTFSEDFVHRTEQLSAHVIS